MGQPVSLRSFAVAATISTLVFFPLLNALAIDHGDLLHWRTQDTLETIGAWSTLSLVVFATIAVPVACGRVRTGEGVNVLWLLIGGFFFFGAVVKTDALHEFAGRHRVAAPSIAVALAALFSILAILTLARIHRWDSRPFERATLVLSPLVLVFLFQLGNAQWNHREPPDRGPSSAGRKDPPSQHSHARARTLILLFDELSPDYFYGAKADALQRMPYTRQLVSESRLYLGAFLPGGETRVAIPALFKAGASQLQAQPGPEAQRQDGAGAANSNGWLGRAVGRGLDVRVFGWYLDYCTGVAVSANACRAVSLYNARTVREGLSLFHPFWTILSLLPADAPFGMLKIRPAAELHRATAAAATAWMHAQLGDDRADVVYVHVNLPHVPFLGDDVFDRDRFVVTEDRYVEQLRFVDAFLADVVVALAHGNGAVRPTRLIVMSDHNVRALTPTDRHEEVVFVVRAADGSRRGTDRSQVNAADLLARLVVEIE